MGPYNLHPTHRASWVYPPLNLREHMLCILQKNKFILQEKDLVFYKQLSTYIKINYYEINTYVLVCYPDARELHWIINELGLKHTTKYRRNVPVLGMHVYANAWGC